MPRTKKIEIYEKENRPYRSDFELVEKAQQGEAKAYEELWDKYFLLRQKEKFSFIKWCKGHHIERAFYEDFVDTWDNDAYEKFYNQMSGVRLDELVAKGHTSDNWKIAIRLTGYFQVVNRSYTTKILNKLNKETAEISIHNKDDEKSNSLTNIDIQGAKSFDEIKPLAKKVFNIAWQAALDEMTDKQRKLIEMKSEGASMSAISSKLNVSAKVIKQVITHSKDRLSYWVAKKSEQMNTPMKYADMLEYLQ